MNTITYQGLDETLEYEGQSYKLAFEPYAIDYNSLSDAENKDCANDTNIFDNLFDKDYEYICVTFTVKSNFSSREKETDPVIKTITIDKNEIINLGTFIGPGKDPVKFRTLDGCNYYPNFEKLDNNKIF